MCTLSPCGTVVISDTGVPKSVTSRRRRRLGGRPVFMKSTSTVLPTWRTSTATWLFGRSTTMRPSPLAPRLKSMSRRIWRPAGRGAAATGMPALLTAWATPPEPSTVTITDLPSIAVA